MEKYDETESILGGGKPMSEGLGILFIVLIFYMFGFIYLIYSRFLSDIIEDLIYLAEAKGGENVSQITFCVLNSLGVLIYCFIANFYSKSDASITTVLGTDIYHICFLYAFLLVKVILKNNKKNQEGRNFDAWLILRDMLLYLITLGVLTLFLYFEDVEWWMSLIQFSLTIIFFIVVQKNDSIKDKIYRMIGLTNEDDSFNADEQLKQVKKSVSIEVLVQNKFIDRNAEDLKKRIAKNEGLIIMKHGNKDDKRAQILMKFHAAVYVVMFAIRNKNNYEKKLRSQTYAALWKDENDQEEENEVQSPIEQIQNANQYEDNKLLQNQNQNTFGPDQEINMQRQLNPTSQNQYEGASSQNDNGDNDDDDDSDDEVQEISMKFPQGGAARLSYIVFFPFHLILYLVPSYHKDPSLFKLFKCFICNFILLGGTIFLIEWWSFEVALSLNIPISIIGLIVISFGLSLPYIVYNMKICKKEQDNVEFFQSYLELGISKIGMCIGLPWLFNNLINFQSTVNLIIDDGIKHVAASYTSVIFLIFIFILCNSFKANKLFAFVLIFLMVCFLIASCVLLLIDI